MLRVIPGFDGLYRVSDDGLVYSSHTRGCGLRGKARSLSVDGYGYYKVNLSNREKRVNAKVHRLVAECFLPNPCNFPEVNHINGNKKDNRVENLEWCTFEHNRRHAIVTGLYKNQGEGNGQAMLKRAEVDLLRRLRESGIHFKVLMKMFKISQTNFYRIIKRESWK